MQNITFARLTPSNVEVSSAPPTMARLDGPSTSSSEATIDRTDRKEHSDQTDQKGGNGTSSYRSITYETIEGRRWYYRLIPQREKGGWGLMDEHPINTLDGWLVMCLVVPTESTRRGRYKMDYGTKPGRSKDKPTTRLYSAFQTYIVFFEYQRSFTPHRRSFFEIILGEFAQKPHFDIDMDFADIAGMEEDQKAAYAERVKDLLVESIVVTLNRLGVAPVDIGDNILLYTSHSTTKRSYHVIVDRWSHPNNIEARAFYNEVVAMIAPSEAQWIDVAVYSPRQQFRIVGSQKIGSFRPKIFCKTWMFKGLEIVHRYQELPDSPEHELLIQFEESLASQTNNCTMLPMIGPPTSDPSANGGFGSLDGLDQDLEPELVRAALKATAEYGKVNSAEFPYSLTAIRGSLLVLKRLRPSRCPVCIRVHEHENPFLTVGPKPDNSSLRPVYFHCRRAETGLRLLIGNIVDNSITVTEGRNDHSLASGQYGSTGSTGTTKERSDRLLGNGERSDSAPNGNPGSQPGPEGATQETKLSCVPSQHRTMINTFIQSTVLNRVNALATQSTVRQSKLKPAMDPEIARQLMLSMLGPSPNRKS
jgi:hypothetical protein